MSKEDESISLSTTLKRSERDAIQDLGEGNLASGIRRLLKYRAILDEILERVLCDETEEQPVAVDQTALELLRKMNQLKTEKKRPA